jgi:hypothetical protein
MMTLRFLTALALCLAAAGCGSRPQSLHVNPSYQAGARIGDHTSWLRPGAQLSIQLVDQRQTRPGFIGQNIEERSEPIAILESRKGATAHMVYTAIATELQGLGVQVVDPSAARHIIRIHLLNLWIQEDNTYNGEVRARVMVLDPAGRVLSDGIIVGTSKRFGSSLSVENYQETITSMTRELIEHMMEHKSFQNAFRA